MNAKKNYDESSIKSLDALSHIRTRPGMYIGRLGDGSEPEDGIYILLKEVIDNSVDEFIMNHGQRIDLAFDEKTQKMSVRDYGRGIPLGKVIECVSQINTGAKYDNEVFQFSVGLNGVGLKAVNALSSHFYVESYRDRKVLKLLFEQGVLKWKKEEKSQEPSGTFVSFIPDSTIFKKYSFKKELIHKKLWTYAYLNQGLSLKYQEDTFYSENGLLDFLMHHIGKEPLYAPFHLKGPLWECAFVHTAHHGETYYSFTNGQYLSLIHI